MRFVDLFAGLGGFHLALSRLGHECVFASELDDALRRTYEANFGVVAAGDIRAVKISAIPAHDILCAGFPCQPFSKAGDQQGLDCPRWGDLFDRVLAIARRHRPEYLLLENVPNLAKHDNGRTWAGMKSRLVAAGYEVQDHRFSPHQFGIPQVRDRIYVVGRRSGLGEFVPPIPVAGPTPADIRNLLTTQPAEAKLLSRRVVDCLDVWQEFVARFPKDEELPSWPVWAMEFGATYPFEQSTPYGVGTRALCRYRGSLGRSLRELPPADRMSGLPSHGRTPEAVFPRWKSGFIRRNRDLYARHKEWIDPWLPRVRELPPSWQKFEWNCKGGERDVWKYVIQFRASGVRVKRPTTSPSLVAMTATQVPIIGWERRYMTPRECARLQGLATLKHLPPADTRAFKALGNAVNADVVHKLASALVRPASARVVTPSRSIPAAARVTGRRAAGRRRNHAD